MSSEIKQHPEEMFVATEPPCFFSFSLLGRQKANYSKTPLRGWNTHRKKRRA
jgi:hypothetical protein